MKDSKAWLHGVEGLGRRSNLAHGSRATSPKAGTDASACSSQFQYTLYCWCGEEVRAQFIILHLLCEPLHNRNRSGKCLVRLLHLSTGCVHFSECYFDLPQLAWQSNLFC